MEKKPRRVNLRVLSIVGCVCILALALVACAPKGDAPKAADQPTVAKNAAGVWTAADWSTIYPNEFETYSENAMNSTAGNVADPHFEVRGDMVEMYPMIKIIWEGTPFSKFYNEPNGHQYALDDIRATGRITEKSLANCLTCKSADFTAMYQEQGNAIMSQPFADVSSKVEEPISCYNCHENDPKTLAVTQAFFADATAKDAANIPEESLVCGQCHNEYYFNPADKAVTNPYKTTDEMLPEAMYEYYKTAGAEGAQFVDYTNPSNGTKQLKTQHPEFEFIYSGAGSKMAQQGYSCADCHMGAEQKDANGNKYRSHLLISPLENETLLKSCNAGGSCHTDLASQVAAWQKTSEDKVMAVGNKLVDLNTKLTAAVAAGSMSEDQLNAIRELNREAQWYWDYVMVENSEGAHNPGLSDSTLDRSGKLVDQALALLA